MTAYRQHVLAILVHFERSGKRLSTLREAYFSTPQVTLEDRDRQRILALTQEVVRWRGRLDWWLQAALDRPLSRLERELLVLLRIGVYELLMEKSPAPYAVIDQTVTLARQRVGERATGLVNAVLRRLAAAEGEGHQPDFKRPQERAAWLSHPRWLLERWEERYGREAAAELCRMNNRYRPLGLRLNPARMDPERLIVELTRAGIEVERWKDSECFFQVRKGGQKLRRSALFRQGVVSLQDRAAGGVVELLDPQAGETILDVCAAPGTKSLYLAERMRDQGRILASDSVPQRVALARSDRNRHGMRSIHWEVKDATRDEYPPADGILIDAPCTGTGVIGRRPDIRWRREAADLDEMPPIQLAILQHSARFVKPGGRLVYATCSLEPEENWQVIEAFFKLDDRFQIESAAGILPETWIGSRGALETLPSRDEVDGVFAVKLRARE